MRIFIALSLLMVSGAAVASEKLVCEYAVGALSTPPNLLTKGNANVIFDGKSFTAYRLDGSFVVTPPLTEKKDGMIFVDDKTKVFAASLDISNFAVSDRIKKTTEQWDKCSVDVAKDGPDRTKSDVKEQMKRIASIPWGGKEAHKFFLKETHLFMLLECGWAGSVGFSTGYKPLVMIGESYYQGESASFKNGEYSITFNGGSMRVAYNPQKVSGYISDAHSFTPCSAVRLGED
ncbi:TPA: hypothetical protein ACIJUA_003940 [Klebsiella pneumoniae]|nr:hypothetical protein [Klebsiella pneumoniae]HED4281139.1 hypothetical protein [Klebsiella pneumoniae]